MRKGILFIIIQMVASLVQSISGFAGTPISIPPTTLLYGLTDAKAMVTLIMTSVSAFMAIKLKKDIDKKHLLIIVLFMLPGILIGLYLFNILPIPTLMMIYGSIVILIGIKKLVKPSDKKITAPWSYIVLVLAGVMQGMFSSGGPFMVLYLSSEVEDKDTFRATNSAIWAILNIILISRNAINGLYSGDNIKLVLLAVIPVFAAALIGDKISTKINKAVFLKIVYALLIFSGAILIYNAL